MIERSKRLSIYRAVGFLVLGVVSGMQIALYMYDYYDDGVAEFSSLLIGILLLTASLGFVLYAFRRSA